MQITKAKSNEALLVKAQGRIDLTTAVEYGMQINDWLDDYDNVKTLVLDFSEIDYVSSVGLRVILELQKRMNKEGSMKIINVQENVREVFEMTGFVNIMTIE